MNTPFSLCSLELQEVNSEADCMQHNPGETILLKASQNIPKNRKQECWRTQKVWFVQEKEVLIQLVGI